MADAMNKLIREQMWVLVDKAGVPADGSAIDDKINELERDLSKSEDKALCYAAGYLRACAELANVTVSELLENL